MFCPDVIVVVSEKLGMDHTEVCGMHDGDKLGQSAVGALVRTKNKVVVNPFPEDQAVMKKAHDLVVHFSYGTRLKLLHEFGKVVPLQPLIKLKVDLNGTRIVAQHILLFSGMMLSRLLKTYVMSNPEAISDPPS